MKDSLFWDEATLEDGFNNFVQRLGINEGFKQHLWHEGFIHKLC